MLAFFGKSNILELITVPFAVLFILLFTVLTDNVDVIKAAAVSILLGRWLMV